MTPKAKKWIIISASILAALAIIAITIVYLYQYMPRAMDIDWDGIKQANNGVTLLAADDPKNATGNPALVKLDENDAITSSEWKVLQFTDMHLSHEMDTTNATIKNFIDALNREKPDFVVLTGDIVTRLGGKVRLEQLAEIFEKAGIYWVYVLGNHEGDSDPYTVSRTETIRTVAAYDHCLTDPSEKKTSDDKPVWGIGNCVVNLLGADYNVVQSMIFMDSGDHISQADYDLLSATDPAMSAKSAENTYDYLKDTQKQWYAEQVRSVTENLTNGVKTMLFIHIPLVEQGYIRYLAAGSEIPEGYSKIAGSDLVVNGETIGFSVLKDGWKVSANTYNYEGCCSSTHNNGMYALMKEMRAGVNGLFCGHDHINNTILYEEGVEPPVYLGYGTCSGVQGYSLYKNGMSEEPGYPDRGYSVITIHSSSNFDVDSVLYAAPTQPIHRIVGGVAVD